MNTEINWGTYEYKKLESKIKFIPETRYVKGLSKKCGKMIQMKQPKFGKSNISGVMTGIAMAQMRLKSSGEVSN